MRAVLSKLVLVLALARGAVAQDAIVLRARAEVAPGAAITLGDVASLSGAGAERLAGTRLGDGPRLDGRPVEIGVRAVRQALERDRTINWGRLTLSGRACEVRARASAAAAAPEPAPARPSGGGARVRDHCLARLASDLGVGEADVRLAVDLERGGRERGGIADEPVAGRTVVVAPIGESDRPQWNVRVYDGGAVVLEGMVRATATVRRGVLVAERAIARGESLDAARLVEEERWLAPSVRPLDRSRLAGARARARVEAGRVLVERDAEMPASVRKGDLIAVDAIVGTIVVRLSNCRALEGGADGDVIAAEVPASLEDERAGRRAGGAREGRRIMVRITGAARGVAVDDGIGATRRVASRGE